MTAAEISALREQVTEIYKKVWQAWKDAERNQYYVETECGDKCAEFEDAEYTCCAWESTKDYIGHAVERLLDLQCDAAKREREGLK